MIGKKGSDWITDTYIILTCVFLCVQANQFGHMRDFLTYNFNEIVSGVYMMMLVALIASVVGIKIHHFEKRTCIERDRSAIS